jgi:hypothetical protein
MASMYADLIGKAVPGVPARLVEAWMRLEHSTLDGLSRSQFNRAARTAAQCLAASDPTTNEALAASYGL